MYFRVTSPKRPVLPLLLKTKKNQTAQQQQPLPPTAPKTAQKNKMQRPPSQVTKRCHETWPHTIVSASMKTHFENCVSSQQCSFVSVTPSSGLFISAKCAESPLSNTFTNTTSSKTFSSTLLGKESIAEIQFCCYCSTRAGDRLHKEKWNEREPGSISYAISKWGTKTFVWVFLPLQTGL